MNVNQTKSNVGEWLFLLGGAVLVGGYLAYENLATVQGWLDTLTATVAPTAGLVGFIAGNWGFILLVIALIIAALKMPLRSTPTDATIEYKRHKHLPVNLIR